ncbi:hypothetical protein [Halomonas denitrificans]|uniref:hypothetical protein n=1 Tax=Halomonas denitrificans TaxID=370769 RepID=UPI001C9A2583|nr:hypothetical protein [Halomonas denitrificans]MBY5967269.1 hypothetical protein [Halomonas denitrificans]
MSESEEKHPKPSALEGSDCVPFFKDDKKQIIFEFFYLVVTLALACVAVFLVHVKLEWFGVGYESKFSLYALLGGFLGGWVYDAKWFYRVTARGKSDQYDFSWQSHKFYWRIMTPFLASLVAFSAYMLIGAGVFPIKINGWDSARVSISICFVLGYFSDLVLSRLAKWAERILPKVSDE